MKLRSKVFLSSLIITVMGMAGLALTYSMAQAHRNAESAPASQSSTASMQADSQTVEPIAATTSPQVNAQATTSASQSSASTTNLRLDPAFRDFLVSLRDWEEKSGFTDVQLDSPYYDSTLILQVAYIFNGFPDGSAGLSKPLTRAQAASVLNRTFAFSLFVPTTTVFSDVPAGSTHEKAINALYWAGISNGCTASPRNYCPDQAITRKQFATLLAKSLQPYVPMPQTDAVYTYSDVPSGDTAAPYLNYLTLLGVINGCGNGKFCPDQPLTRAQAVTIMVRALYGSDLTPNRTQQ